MIENKTDSDTNEDAFSVLESPEYDYRFRVSSAWSATPGWDEDAVEEELRFARLIGGKLCVSDRALRRLGLQTIGSPFQGATTFWWPIGDCDVGVEFRAKWWNRRHERERNPRRSRIARRSNRKAIRNVPARKLEWVEEGR